MYPQVFKEFQEFKKKYGDVLCFPHFLTFMGSNSEEISITIEEGKTLFIKLLYVGEADEKEFVPLHLN